MIGALRSLLCSALLFGLVGCGTSGLSDRVKEIAGNDFQRTSELAEKYGKPQVKVCSDFLLAQFQNQDSAQAKLDALLKEPTNGIFSEGLKAALVAEMVRELASPASRAQFEKDFKDKCNAVAGDIMIQALRDARKIGTRTMF